MVLVQGRNLGTCRDDIVSVHVGGVDCTRDVQYFSSEKIVVHLPRNAQLSPVAVVTKSGIQYDVNFSKFRLVVIFITLSRCIVQVSSQYN